MAAGLTAMPASPDCQVSEYLRPGSKLTLLQIGPEVLEMFGMLAWSISLEDSRAGSAWPTIQSVTTNTSAAIAWPPASCGWILAKYSSLSLTSSV